MGDSDWDGLIALRTDGFGDSVIGETLLAGPAEQATASTNAEDADYDASYDATLYAARRSALRRSSRCHPDGTDNRSACRAHMS